MSQVNLLPPDILRGQRFRRLTGIVAIAGAFLALVILALYVMQISTLSSVNDDIEAQQQTNAGIQTEVDSLRKYAILQADAQAKGELLKVAYANEVSFSAMLMDMSRVIPSDVDLDTLSMQVASTSDTTATTTTTTNTGLIGTVTGGGTGASIDTLANFLVRLESVKGWANPWISTLSRAQDTGFVSYTVGIDITSDAVTPRGREASGA